MKINGTYTFPAPAETVWDLLLDPQVLLQVIPGLESVDVKPGGEILATAMVGVGPVKGRFTGTLRLLDQQKPTHVRITGEGKGGPGFMKGTCILDASEQNGSTLVKYQAEIQIGGPLATVGQRLVDAATNSIMQQGFDRFNQVLTERRAAQEAARALEEATALATAQAGVAAANIYPAWFALALGLGLIAAVALVYFSK
jgi:carbon monoxide dehydrogenase subunit G